MVHDAESEPASNDASASMHDMMADLPPLLLGTYTPKIDAKGRMALPAKFRSQLGPGMVMARGQERCVYLLPQMEFRRIAMQIQRTSMGNKAAHTTVWTRFGHRSAPVWIRCAQPVRMALRPNAPSGTPSPPCMRIASPSCAPSRTDWCSADWITPRANIDISAVWDCPTNVTSRS